MSSWESNIPSLLIILATFGLIFASRDAMHGQYWHSFACYTYMLCPIKVRFKQILPSDSKVWRHNGLHSLLARYAHTNVCCLQILHIWMMLKKCSIEKNVLDQLREQTLSFFLIWNVYLYHGHIIGTVTCEKQTSIFNKNLEKYNDQNFIWMSRIDYNHKLQNARGISVYFCIFRTFKHQ